MSETSLGCTVTGSTKFVGVIGDPVSHSLSPRLHNRAYRALGLDLCYGAFRVREGEAPSAIDGALALGFRGLSVTTPHKDAAARHADQRTDEVAKLNAANTIVFDAGVAVAHSTDGIGLLHDLDQHFGFDPNGQSCAVIGAGGAARAIILALARASASEVIVVNRNRSRATAAGALAPDVVRIGTLEEMGNAQLVVNATSLGLGVPAGDPDVAATASSFAASLHRGQIAIDISYRPARTLFLEAAEARGAQIRNGLGMLVHQAAEQVRLFTGEAAPLAEMWDSVSELGEP